MGAGVTCVAAYNDTNSTSSSSSSDATTSDTNGTSSSSSSDATTASNTNGTSSSSSDATTAGSSSSSAAANNNNNGGSSSSTAGNNNNNNGGSSSTAGNNNNNNGGGSSSTAGNNNNNNNGNTNSSGDSAPAAPAEVKHTIGVVEVPINLPSNATSASLMADTNFKSGVEAGICDGLGKPATDCTVRKFTLKAARRLSERRLTNADKKLEVDFVVKMTKADFETKIATVTGTGNTGATSLLGKIKAGLTNSGATAALGIVIDDTVVVTAPVIKETRWFTSGTYTLMWYDDAACSTTATGTNHGDVTDGQINYQSGKDVKWNNAAANTCLIIHQCAEAVHPYGNFNTGAVCPGTLPTSMTSLTGLPLEGECKQEGTKYLQIKCTEGTGGGGGSTSDASSKSIVGVIMGLAMGLITLM